MNNEIINVYRLALWQDNNAAHCTGLTNMIFATNKRPRCKGKIKRALTVDDITVNVKC